MKWRGAGVCRVGGGNVRGSLCLLGFILQRRTASLPNFMTIHPIIVQIKVFDRQADIHSSVRTIQMSDLVFHVVYRGSVSRRFRVTWGLGCGGCVYQQTKGYCFWAFFGWAQHTEYTEHKIHWTTWTIWIYHHCIPQHVRSYAQPVSVDLWSCSFTTLWQTTSLYHTDYFTRKWLAANFSPGSDWKRRQKKKSRSELTWLVSDVEADDEKPKGLKDE